MKHRIKKVVAGFTAFFLVFLLVTFSNTLVGNPISKKLAKSAAENHLSKQYSGTDYYLESIVYNYKNRNYNASIKSPSSIDTDFSLTMSMLGTLENDTFEDVANGTITARRVNSHYQALTTAIFNHPSFPYHHPDNSGVLDIHSDSDTSTTHSHSLKQEELILDKIYNVPALGCYAGHLQVHIEDIDVTYRLASEVLLGIKAQFDEAGVPFAIIDLYITHPDSSNEIHANNTICIKRFPYTDIIAENLENRILAYCDK